MSVLPPSWAVVRLGDIGTPERLALHPATRPDLPYLGLEHVEANTTVIRGTVPASSVRSTSYYFAADSTLYARLRPYLNKVCTPSFDGLGSGEFIVFPPVDHLAHGYLKYLLNQSAFVAFTATLDSGDRPRVGWDDIREFGCALPPLAEQKRIVAVIEEQFSRLDSGVAALDAASFKAGTLATAAMEAAVSRWDDVPLREVVRTLRNGIFVSRPGTAPTRRAILRISAVRPLKLDASDVRYVPESTELRNENAFRIEAGDLLFTRYNGNAELVGGCALVGADAAGLLYPDKLIRAVVNRSRAMPDYLEIALNCGPSLRAIADRRKTTAGQVGIAGAQLLDVPVPLPSLADQERIVAQTRSVLDASRMLRLVTARARTRCESLRSAILAAAFSGKLAPQYPDDEPASVLLERIAAERASSNGFKKMNARKLRTSRPKAHA